MGTCCSRQSSVESLAPLDHEARHHGASIGNTRSSSNYFLNEPHFCVDDDGAISQSSSTAMGSDVAVEPTSPLSLFHLATTLEEQTEETKTTARKTKMKTKLRPSPVTSPLSAKTTTRTHSILKHRHHSTPTTTTTVGGGGSYFETVAGLTDSCDNTTSVTSSSHVSFNEAQLLSLSMWKFNLDVEQMNNNNSNNGQGHAEEASEELAMWLDGSDATDGTLVVPTELMTGNALGCLRVGRVGGLTPFVLETNQRLLEALSSFGATASENVIMKRYGGLPRADRRRLLIQELESREVGFVDEEKNNNTKKRIAFDLFVCGYPEMGSNMIE
eukprot:PhM_4_TR16410/c0_g1_i1/m.48532